MDAGHILDFKIYYLPLFYSLMSQKAVEYRKYPASVYSKCNILHDFPSILEQPITQEFYHR